jgi:hypothetical protein
MRSTWSSAALCVGLRRACRVWRRQQSGRWRPAGARPRDDALQGAKSTVTEARSVLRFPVRVEANKPGCAAGSVVLVIPMAKSVSASSLGRDKTFGCRDRSFFSGD